MDVIALIESGVTEYRACKDVGINRNTFRAAALVEGCADTYAKAMASLAHLQILKMEKAIDDMRAGKIDAAMARVEIDARKWFASKFLAKKYGDKIQHADADGEKLPPVQFLIQPVAAKPE